MITSNYSDLYSQVGGEEKLLLSLIFSAIKDKDMEFLTGEATVQILKYLNLPATKYQKLFVEAATSGKTISIKES